MEIEKINRIINKKQLRTVFQPIFSLINGEIIGYEAFSRFWDGDEIISPIDMFASAYKHKKNWELELLCRSTALETARSQGILSEPFKKKLFINVNPQLLNDEAYESEHTKIFLEQYNIPAKAITFEITERNYIENIEDFKKTVKFYKEQGYSIAIDDVGAGYAGLDLIKNLDPDFIKLDRRLIRNIDSDYIKAALVRGMIEFAKMTKNEIIAEGIETYEELEAIVKLGVNYAQGFFTQKPTENVIELNQAAKEAIKIAQLNTNKMLREDIYYYSIKQITKRTPIIHPDASASEAYDLINNIPNCNGLCIVGDDGVPVGIITKVNLALKLSGRYGYTLYQNKPISVVMDTNFLTFDSKTPINIVATESMNRPNDTLYDFIVITEEERYVGTVTIKRMFQKSLELKVMTAEQQSPLTGLPGNLLIQQRIAKLIDCEKNYSVAYLDIDYFKAYNDVYGFQKGDAIIKLLANILEEFVPNNQFIGHIGGDDFIIAYDEHISYKDLIPISDIFEAAVTNFYSPEDIKNGYTSTMNRQGTLENTPLVGLTTVVVNNKNKAYSNPHDITEELARLKSESKRFKAADFSQRI